MSTTSRTITGNSRRLTLAELEAIPDLAPAVEAGAEFMAAFTTPYGPFVVDVALIDSDAWASDPRFGDPAWEGRMLPGFRLVMACRLGGGRPLGSTANPFPSHHAADN